MKASFSSFFYIFLLSHLPSAISIKFPLDIALNSRSGASKFTVSRISTTSTNSSTSGNIDDIDSLSDVHDLIYMANISVAGQVFPVQLDTGSSDLWVQGLTNVEDTSMSYNLTYGLGWAQGNISYASVEIAGITVSSQALLDVNSASNPATAYGAKGIAGLGFTSLSAIDSMLNGTGQSTGSSLLYNAFMGDPSMPNIMTFSLQSSLDPNDDVQGIFSIGEIDSAYANITDMPSISTFPGAYPERWTIPVDSIIVGSRTINFPSNVTDAPSNKVIALIDSGTSFCYISSEIANAIYGDVEGASYDPSSGEWDVPCSAEIDVAVQIAGQVYPLNPLDVVPQSLSDPTKCTGSFIGQSISVDEGDFDILLGLTFLRAVYSLFDFGLSGPDGALVNPSIKFLSVVNPDQASVDFHSLRGGTALTNITYNASNISSSSTSGSSPSSSSDINSDTLTVSNSIVDSLNKIIDYIPAMLAILAINVIVLLVVCGVGIYALIMRSSKGRRGKKGMIAMPLGRTGSRAPTPYPHVYEPVDTLGAEDPPFVPPQPTDSMGAEDPAFLPPTPAFHIDGAIPRPDAPGLRPYSMMTSSSMGGVPRAYRASAASDATAFTPPSPGFLQTDSGKWVADNRPKSIA